MENVQAEVLHSRDSKKPLPVGHNQSGEKPGGAPVVILGAGPAGLTAAYELSNHGVASIVLEKDAVVGGLARTVEYNGYLFDIGGHRFFTKVALVDRIWNEILGSDLLSRPRSSRIYYKSKFFHYPLDPFNVLHGLGLPEIVRCGLSYVKSHLFPRHPEHDFETWVSNRFGKRLFEIFFKSYTEKVWGMPCNRIHAEWAAQRIRGLSLPSLVRSAMTPKRDGKSIKTLIKEFHYPRRGPGMMWSKMSEIVSSRGCRVVLQAPVSRIHWQPGRVTAVETGDRLYRAENFICSIPIRELIEKLDPEPPEELRHAAKDFNYRDFLTVALIVQGAQLFPDNWIYVHEPEVAVGRIQNYKNWSPEMVPDSSTTCLGLEYFCSEGDTIWSLSDEELIDLGRRELAKLGLADPDSVIDGTVVRAPKAYPVYDEHYRRGLAAVHRFLTTVPNFQLVGRNGMHRYNNQDHSMLTAILAARNILGGKYDLWGLNLDPDYQEEGTVITEEELQAFQITQPLVPGTVSAAGAEL